MIQVRRAGPGDSEAFIRFRMRMFQEMGKLPVDPVPLTEATERYFNSNIDRSLLVWLAECGGQAVGGGGLWVYQRIPYPNNLDGSEGYIMSIYTLPAYRGQGAATALVEEMIRYARDAQIHKLWLHATDAGRFVYRKLGFQGKDTEMQLVL